MPNPTLPTLEEISLALSFCPITEEVRRELGSMDVKSLDKSDLPYIPSLFAEAVRLNRGKFLPPGEKIKEIIRNEGKSALKNHTADIHELFSAWSDGVAKTYVGLVKNLIFSLHSSVQA